MTEQPAQITGALPECWPTTPAAEPVRAWWIPWPLAVVAVPLLWILPKRMGPHLAAVRWPGVITAHLVWTLYGITCIYLGVNAPECGWIAWFRGNGNELPAYAQMTCAQAARAPVAQVVWDLCGRANFKGYSSGPRIGFPEIYSVADLLLWLGIVVGTEIALAVPALLLMPYIAAGERTRRLFFRSLKLTFLSVTILFPVSLGLQCAVIWLNPSFDDEVAFTLVTALGCIWFCWIWIRAGMRYAGPAEGPGWEPLKVLCENCGYSLTGQQVGGRCPECGWPVAYSLPSSRRPTPLTAARDRVSAVSGFLITYLAAVAKGDFFKRIPVHAEFSTARRFVIWSSIVFFPITLLVTLVCMSPVVEWAEVAGEFPPAGSLRLWIESLCMLASFWAFTAIGLLLVFGVVTLACAWGGWKPVRPRAVVVFYWSAMLVPLYAALCAATAITIRMGRSPLLARIVDLGGWGHWEWFVLLAPVPYIVIVVPALIVTGKRLARGIVATRYANA